MAYTLTHPDSDRELSVEADRVPLYLAQGWLTKPNVKPPPDPEAK